MTTIVTELTGIVPEYALAHHRFAGPRPGTRTIAAVDRPAVRTARIAARPRWAGVRDFVARFPGAAIAKRFVEQGR